MSFSFLYRLWDEVTGKKDGIVRCRGEIPGAAVMWWKTARKNDMRRYDMREATRSLTMTERLPSLGPSDICYRKQL